MKEVLELRINYKYAYLLFTPEEGKNLGTSIKVVELTKDDPRFKQIPIIAKQVKEKYKESFYFGWRIKRSYGEEELINSILLHMKITSVFEPTGEECGTKYDENEACSICGVNRKQISLLHLKKNSIPHKDISKTIAGEIVVSEKFVEVCKKYELKGVSFEKILLDNNITSAYFQLVISSPNLELSKKTVAGIDPFNNSVMSEENKLSISGYNIKFEKEVYKCPKGHTLGLNLLSEPYILNSPEINDFDFFITLQKIGVKRGLLRPEPIYLCSSKFMKIVKAEKLTGIEFELANVV